MATGEVCKQLRYVTLPNQAASHPAAPEPKYHPRFRHATHTSLQTAVDVPLHDNVPVSVFDPSKSRNIQLNLKITDTTDTLIDKYLKMRPELGGDLDIAYNGKPVPKQKLLGDLGVKAGAVFVTFQRCAGG